MCACVCINTLYISVEVRGRIVGGCLGYIGVWCIPEGCFQVRHRFAHPRLRVAAKKLGAQRNRVLSGQGSHLHVWDLRAIAMKWEMAMRDRRAGVAAAAHIYNLMLVYLLCGWYGAHTCPNHRMGVKELCMCMCFVCVYIYTPADAQMEERATIHFHCRRTKFVSRSEPTLCAITTCTIYIRNTLNPISAETHPIEKKKT